MRVNVNAIYVKVKPFSLFFFFSYNYEKNIILRNVIFFLEFAKSFLFRLKYKYSLFLFKLIKKYCSYIFILISSYLFSFFFSFVPILLSVHMENILSFFLLNVKSCNAKKTKNHREKRKLQKYKKLRKINK